MPSNSPARRSLKPVELRQIHHQEEEVGEEEEEREMPRFPGQPHPSAALSKLSAMKVKRDLDWRSGRSWVCANRTGNHEAAAAFCVGRVALPACGRCSRGLGPFASCIVVPGLLSGACANCHWGSGGKECSLHSKYLQSFTDVDRFPFLLFCL